MSVLTTRVPQAIRSLSPSLYWRLDDASSPVADSSGNGRTGTVGASVSLSQPTLHQSEDPATSALMVDAAGGIINASYAAFPQNSQRTFTGWFIRNSTTNLDFLFGANGGANEPFCFCDTSNQFRWRPNGAGGADTVWTTSPALAGGIPFHWALTYDDSTGLAELFINGVSQGQQTVTAGTNRYQTGNTGINCGSAGAGGSNTMDGRIQDFAVFERILTGAQIFSIYKAGVPIMPYPFQVLNPLNATPALYWRLGDAVSSAAPDSSGYGFGGTLGAGVSSPVQPGAIPCDPVAACLYFNGASNAVLPSTAAFFTAGRTITFMGWANKQDSSTIYGLMSGAGTFASAPLLYVDASNQVIWAATETDQHGFGVNSWPGNLQWVHWALTYNDTSKVAELFINGVSKGTVTVTTPFTPASAGNFQLSSASVPWKGWMQDAAVYGFIPSAAAIAAIYDASKFGLVAPNLPHICLEADVTTNPTTGTRTWTPLTQYGRSLNYRSSGRSSELQRSSTGQLTALVSDRGSVVSGMGLKKRQWVRVRSFWYGTVYPEWQGIIEAPVRKWPAMGLDSTIEIRAAGVFKILKLFPLDNTTRPSERNDQRIAAWAASANLPTTGFSTDTDTADAVSTPFGTGTDALSQATTIEESENGLLVETRAGQLQFQGRHYRFFNSTVSKATFGETVDTMIPYSDDVEYDDDDAYVANYVSVTPLGGSAQVAQDAGSQASRWVSTFTRSLVSSSAGLALAAAQWLLSVYKNPQSRIPAVTVNMAALATVSPLRMPTLLSANQSDRFTWQRQAAVSPISADVYIEEMEETIVPGQWAMKLQLSPAIDQPAWVLGSATLGLLGQTTVVSY